MILESKNIYSSRKYDTFSFLEGNRIPDKASYERLKNVVLKSKIINPIIVNEKMQIIDGQSRFLLSKEFGLEVKYVVGRGFGLNHAAIFNTVRTKWSKIQYLNMYISKKKVDYKHLKNIKDRYCVDLGILLKAFAFNQKKTIKKISEEFEDGTLKVINKDENVLLFLEALKMFKEKKILFYKNSMFVNALLETTSHPNFSLEILNKSFHKHAYTPQTSKNDYKRDLVNIYNSCSRKKLSM